MSATVTNHDSLHQAGHRADKEKNEAVTKLGDSHHKEKNEAVTNIGGSHQDGHKGGGKTKKKTKVGRELQVRTTTGGKRRAT